MINSQTFFEPRLQFHRAPLLRGRCAPSAPVVPAAPAPVVPAAPAPVVPAAPTVLAITQADFRATINECLKVSPAGRCGIYAAHGPDV